MVFIDFDGTIIDLWPRYCSVFNSILHLRVAVDEYRAIKQKLKKDTLVAEYFNTELPGNYFSIKRIMLEDPEFLNMDNLLFEIEILNKLLDNGVSILTKRRNKNSYLQQLKRFGIKGKSVVIDDYSKASWIEHNCDLHTNNVLIIGDSFEELEIAKKNIGESWMVGYGLLTKEDFDITGTPYCYYDNPILLQNALVEKVEHGNNRCDS